MGKKVLLINPRCNKKDFVSCQPPLGLLYLASFLRKNNARVSVIDCNIEPNWKKRLLSELKRTNPCYVGMSSNCSNAPSLSKITSIIKSYNTKIKIVVGGPLPSTDPYFFSKEKNIDIIVYGEGEITLNEIVKGKKINSIKGILHKAKGNILKNPSRPLLKDLDSLPFPALDMVNLKKYYINSYKRKPLSSIITSRGCPYNCIFCSQAVYGHSWRARSVENIMGEILWQKSLGVKELSIEDDNFTLDIKRVKKLCKEIIRKKLDITWQLANGIRVDRLDYETLKLMKQAGCWKIGLAPEVGDESTLKMLNKEFSLDQIKRVTNWCRKLGIVTYGFFIMGFPFEKRENIEKTINFAIEMNPTIMDMAKLVYFPGTKIAKIYKHQKTRKNKHTNYYSNKQSKELEYLYKKAYFKFYLRPMKILDILRNIKPINILNLIRYSIRILV